MKRKYYLAFALLFLTASVYGQQPASSRTQLNATTSSSSGPFADIWSFAQSQFNQAEQAAQSITQLTDGTLVAAGFDALQPNNCKGQFGGAWVIALTPGGSKISQKLYANCSTDDQWANFVRATPDGGFVLSGEDDSTPFCQPCAWIMKFSNTGAIVWQQDLTSFFGSGVNIKPTSDGGYITAGYSQLTSTTPKGGLVMKLSGTGAAQWAHTFTETATSFQGAVANSGDGLGFNSIMPAPDGGYILSGVADTDFSSGFAFALVIMKTDSAGNPQWARAYYSNTWGSGATGDAAQYPIFSASDGGYTISGTVQSLLSPFQDMFFLMHIDSQGNVLWQKGYGGIDKSTGRDIANAISAFPAAEGYVLAGYTSIFLQEWDAWALKTDGLGNIEWQKLYSGTESTGFNSVRFNDIIQTADGGYAAAGSSYVGSLTFGGPGFFVVKTDGQGNIGSCPCVQTTNTTVQALDLQAHDATFTQTNLTPVFMPTNMTGKKTSVTPTSLFP